MNRCLACGVFAAASVLLSGCKHFEPAPLSPAKNAGALESRSLEAPELRAFVERFRKPALEGWPPAQWDFPTLTLVAFYYHPSLDLARAQWNVAKASVRTAGGRPNPIVNVAPGYSMNPPEGLSPWFPLMTVDVPIETAGKRRHRIAHAEHLSEAARLNITSTAWQVRSALRVGLLDYAIARRRADLLQEQLQLQQQIVDLLEQRFQAGAVARSELTLSRLALARAGVDLAEASRQAADARVRIAEALGISVKEIGGANFVSQMPLAAGAGSDLTTAEARQQALLSRPDILATLADYAASESLLHLEIARQYPDVHLSPGYQFDQGEHKWSLGLSAELPVLNRNQGPIAEALAKREETAARFTALQAKVIAEIDRALAARTASLDQVARQEQFTRLARERAASVENLFKAGAADKLELSSAQLEASVSGLANLDAQARAQQALAQLEEAIQRPLESWPALEEARGARAKAP
jgi:outer membrane protein TolC